MTPDLAQLADAFLDGELAAAQWELLLAEHGEPLRRALAEAESVRSTLRALPRSPLPAELRARIAAATTATAPALAAAAPPPAPAPLPLRPQLGSFWRYASPLAAAAALLVAITLTLMNPPPEGPVKAAERPTTPPPPSSTPTLPPTSAPIADAPTNATVRAKSRAVLEPAADALEKSAPAASTQPAGNAAVAERRGSAGAALAAPSAAPPPVVAASADTGKPGDGGQPALATGDKLSAGTPAPTIAPSPAPTAPAPAAAAAFAGGQRRASPDSAPAPAAPPAPAEAKKPAANAADAVSDEEMAGLRRDAETFRKQLAGLQGPAKPAAAAAAPAPAADAADAPAALELALAISAIADEKQREEGSKDAEAKRAAGETAATPQLTFTLRNRTAAEVVLPAGELVLEGLDANHLTSWAKLLRSRSETRIPAGQTFTWQEPLPPLRWQNPVIDKDMGKPVVVELRLRLRREKTASPAVPAPGSGR